MTTCCQPVLVWADVCGTRVCAWCKDVMGPAGYLLPGEVTHGICPTCFAVATKELP